MGADPTPEELRRLSEESDDWTMIFTRVNPSGLVVRDAKFYPDAGSLDVALGLFTSEYAGFDVGLCAVLRGQVKTVDDFEEADQPDPRGQWAVTTLREYRSNPGSHSPFTVYGSWDTGDGPMRHVRHVWAINAEHAELHAREDCTIGTFLVAGVVEGRVPDEQADAVWATFDGTRPAAPDHRSWWRKLLDKYRGSGETA
jgi:hypothetical protein